MPVDVADDTQDDVSRPRVAMIVGNNVSTDNRVLKSATTLARAGLDVTIVGLAPDGVRTETTLGDVRILRVPVEHRLRDARRRNRARRRQRRVVLAGWSDDEGTTTAQVELLAREREAIDSSVTRGTLRPAGSWCARGRRRSASSTASSPRRGRPTTACGRAPGCGRAGAR